MISSRGEAYTHGVKTYRQLTLTYASPLLLCLLLLFPSLAWGTMVVPLSLEQMAQRAEKIFVGTCMSAEPGTDSSGLPVLTLTFAVTEAIKGEVGKTVTFKQRGVLPSLRGGGSAPGQGRASRRILFLIPGLLSYAPGEEVVLFLGREGKLGLTSPIGLFQGKCAVITLPSGKKYVKRSMEEHPDETSTPVSPTMVEYGQFIATVHSLVKAGGGK